MIQVGRLQKYQGLRTGSTLNLRLSHAVVSCDDVARKTVFSTHSVVLVLRSELLAPVVG